MSHFINTHLSRESQTSECDLTTPRPPDPLSLDTSLPINIESNKAKEGHTQAIAALCHHIGQITSLCTNKFYHQGIEAYCEPAYTEAF